MQLSGNQKRLIQRVINVFETGTPDGDYSKIVIFNDGPNGIRQITYGRSQTTEYGNLAELVSDYVAADGLFSEALQPFAARVGRVALTDNSEFKNLLIRAGREDPVMKTTQDRFFDKRYFAPAIAWAEQNGFKLALSALVIYDSFIHSGKIRQELRKTFPEKPPANGGDEKAWTTAYVQARHNWLATHSKKLLRRTIYRTECFQREIARSNWNLSKVPINANGTKVS